jgi:predicted dehydrogenase
MRVLIIGFGSIAKKHLKSILFHNPKSLVYAYRTSNQFIEVENVINIYSLDEFSESIDFIIVSNPTAFHGSTILDIIKFKTPIFIEKPVLNNFHLADSILENIKKNNIITYVGCNLRFHPAIQFLKKYLSTHNTRINEVNIYSGSDLTSWRSNIDYKKSYSSNTNLGGGVHLDLIHEIDYCLWLFGIPKGVSSMLLSKSSLEIDSIDSARYFFEYNEFSIGITLNYFRKDTKRQIEIVTNLETIIIDLIKCKVYTISGLIIFNCEDYNIQGTYDAQLLYFWGCIQNNIIPMNSFEEGLDTLKIALNEKLV